jgi:hypothetical protein
MPRLHAESLVDMLPRPLIVSTKAGPLRNGCELGHGHVWHLAPRDWDVALCGASAAVTFTSVGTPTLICPRCIKLCDQHQPQVVTRDEAAAEPPSMPHPQERRDIPPDCFFGRLLATDLKLKQ